MSWKVGWGEPLNAEHAIASVCHRRLDPLSLVQLQEVLTGRWQTQHPRTWSTRSTGAAVSLTPLAPWTPSHSNLETSSFGLPDVREATRTPGGRLRTELPALPGVEPMSSPSASKHAFRNATSAFRTELKGSASVPDLAGHDAPRALGLSTEVRSFLRSRQSSKPHRSGLSSEAASGGTSRWIPDLQ
ncbi:unnamed protein product [Effrenium voratum]|uniref:Uncharacterized protein n=1 Tax=Effrenium voratum TaxID=2562239 RepID=A0AA36HMX3_9DINO|nr:unnamed protein product [Effrenium voratum]CAJ1371545.1 unnamed protein product [Effrenium voratum]CAJ1453759.1 unnamed protein product [Effrenium voratum]